MVKKTKTRWDWFGLFVLLVFPGTLQINRRQDLTDLHYLTDAIYVDHDQGFDPLNPSDSRQLKVDLRNKGHMLWTREEVERMSLNSRKFERDRFSFEAHQVSHKNSYLSVRSKGAPRSFAFGQKTSGVFQPQIQEKDLELEAAVSKLHQNGFSSFYNNDRRFSPVGNLRRILEHENSRSPGRPSKGSNSKPRPK